MSLITQRIDCILTRAAQLLALPERIAAESVNCFDAGARPFFETQKN